MGNNLCNYRTLHFIQSQLTRLQNISSTKDAHDNAKQTTGKYLQQKYLTRLFKLVIYIRCGEFTD